MTKEINHSFTSAAVRAAKGSDFVIEGIAAPYNVWSSDLGGFHEIIKPGAFARALRQRQDVKCLLNHNANYILGRTKSGTLALTDTPEGLAFRCQLDKRQAKHQEVYAMVQRGDISECSFAFKPAPNGEQWNGDKRTLTDVNLFDVSAVCYPAYPQGTHVDARAEQRCAHYVVTDNWRARIEARLAQLAQVVATDRASGAREEYLTSLAEARAEGWDV